MNTKLYLIGLALILLGFLVVLGAEVVIFVLFWDLEAA